MRRSGIVVAAAAAALVLAACGAPEDGPPTGPPPQPSPEPTSTAPLDAPEPPPAGAGIDYQLGGAYPPPDGVEIVARNWAEEPAEGLYSVCYVNAFQTEASDDDPDGPAAWPAEVVYRDAGDDPAWPGEYPIDTSTPELRDAALTFVQQRLESCADAGYDAVELDNLDTFTRYDGAPFDRQDAIDYAAAIVDAAGELGLAVGQKNTAELLDVGPTEIGFAFVVVEECGQFDECATFADAYDGAVLAIEYTEEGLAAACDAIGGTASVVLRDLDLVPAGEPGYVHETC